MRHLNIFILIITCFFIQSAYAEDDNIYWYHADFPPGSILTGVYAGQGHSNYLERYLKKRMPEYNHSDRSGNYGRILKQLAETNGCCVTLIKTPEREKFIEYSNPVMLFLSAGLLILKSRLPEFERFMTDGGFISIEKILKNSNMKIGISKGRRYGGSADKLIDQYTGSNKIIIHYKRDLLEHLMKSVQSQKAVDCTLGFASEMLWLVSKGKIEDKFTFIPVLEIPKYTPIYAGCSKNEWGKKVIKKINAIIDGKCNEEYKRRYQKFIPKEEIARHDEYVTQFFENISQNGQIPNNKRTDLDLR
ncbi:TIGR02285 family protein [Maridesulfovibrio zosterae]|uniref:TIGR02285 family protein n=1 Tax=Maridesulfovibrio zosterae TaxID=82171 RepID=UPI0003FDAC4A|nr:TIGR02285 family protein [Maridesulfovibrio zosterae]